MALDAQHPATNADAKRLGLAENRDKLYFTSSIWPDNVAASPRQSRAHDQCLTNIEFRRRSGLAVSCAHRHRRPL